MEANLKIQIIGDTGVGKTALLLRFTDNVFKPKQLPTTAVQVKEELISNNGNPVKLVFWDRAGQDSFSRPCELKETQMIILVYDITSQQSFTNIEDWLEWLDKSWETHDLVKMLVGNKCDKEDNRMVTKEEGLRCASKHHSMFMEVSAKTGEGINEAIKALRQEIVQNQTLWEPGHAIMSVREGAKEQKTIVSYDDEEHHEDYPEDYPEEFDSHSWPFPRLAKDSSGKWKPQGKDEALVWLMDYYNKTAGEGRRKRVLVRVSAHFRCQTKECKNVWPSSYGWISFNMRKKTVERQFGQKCRNCRKFYSFPLPFYFSETHPEWSGSDPWRDIVVKAIDLWSKPSEEAETLGKEDVGEGDQEDQEDQEEDDTPQALPLPATKGPHSRILCELCQIKGKPCWQPMKKM